MTATPDAIGAQDRSFNEGVRAAMAYHRAKADAVATAPREADGSPAIESTLAILHHRAMESDLGKLLRRPAAELAAEHEAATRRAA